MTTYNRRRKWYHNIYLEFYLNIPLVTIETRLFKEAYERMAYDICRLRVRLYKWSWDFKLYKRPELSYGTPEPRQKLTQRLMRALRQHWPFKNAKGVPHVKD